VCTTEDAWGVRSHLDAAADSPGLVQVSSGW
jgi:hypothetical protein